MARKTPRLTWPHEGKIAEAEGRLGIWALVLMVFIQSKLARVLVLILALALGWVSVEAITTLAEKLLA